MKTRLVIIICLLLLFMNTAVVLAQDNEIIIPSQVQVKSLNVRLNEIAQVKGSTDFIDQVKKIELGQTPYPGYQRVIYRDDVVYALRQQNLNVARINLKIPYQFTVRADYEKLPVKKLTQFGREYIIEQLNFAAEKIVVDVLNPPEELLVPAGKINFEVTRNYSRRLLGVTMLPIEIKIDGATYRQFHIKFRSEVEIEVLKADKNLNRGQKVTADLFTKETEMVTNQNQDYVTTLSELDGKVLKRNLRVGRPLTYDLLKSEQLVGRWQKVKATAKVSGVEVTITAKALENGSKGDIIRVKNPDSGETLEAKVVARDRVEVIIN